MRKRIFRSGISLMLTAAMLAGSMAVAEPVKADETAETVGTTYYIDAQNGNDSNDGTSESAAWKTFANVDDLTLTEGDQVLLKAGCTWNSEKLFIENAKGTDPNPVVIGKYGDGADPVINGNGNPWNDSKDVSSLKKEDVAAVHIKNSEHIVVQHLEVTNWESDEADLMDDTIPEGGYQQSKSMLTGILVENRDAGELKSVAICDNYVHDVNGYMSTNGSEGDKKGSGGIIALVTGGTTQSYFNNLVITGNKVEKVCHEAIYMESCWAARTLVGGAKSQQAGSLEWVGWSGVYVADNYVNNVAGDGIVLINADGGEAEYNLITASAKEDWNYSRNPAHAAIWMWDCNNVTMQHNEAAYTESTQDGMAFDCDYGNQNVMYQYNYSHDNKGGFWMACPGPYYTVNSVVRYNVSVNDGLFNGGRIIRVGEYGSIGHQVYNNTIYWNNGYELSAIEQGSWTSGVNGTVPGVTSGTDIYNNIFYGDSGTFVDNAGTTYNHNCVWGAAKDSYMANVDDVNAVIADPKFVDVKDYTTGTFDDKNKRVTLGKADGFKLTAASPCIDAGMEYMAVPEESFDAVADEMVETNITLENRDYEGNTVPFEDTKVDIGAFEYQGKGLAPEEIVTDKSYLKALLAQAEAYKESDFEAAGWSAFKTAYDKAQTIEKRVDVLQEVVDAYAKNLENAMMGLAKSGAVREGTPADDTLSSYTSADTVDNSTFEKSGTDWGYWQATVSVSNEQAHTGSGSLKIAKTAGKDTGYSELGKIPVKQNTEYVCEAWIYCGDSAASSVGLEAKHHNSYAGSDIKLGTASAEDVEGDTWKKVKMEFTTQGYDWISIAASSTLDTAYLDDVVLYQKTFTTDEVLERTGLQAVLATVPSEKEDAYTSTAWKNYKNVLTAARLKCADAMASQADLDQAVLDVNEALSALENAKRGNKTVLTAMYHAYASDVQGSYTADTWNAFCSALQNAKVVIDDQDAMQAEIDTALAALVSARNNLTIPAGSGNTTTVTTKADQQITVKDSYTKTAGDKAFTISAKLTAGNGTLKFASSDERVATVSSRGRVTVKGAGICKITVTATATANYHAKTAEILIKVNPKQAAVKSIKAAKGRKMTVKWAKDSSVSGYEIQYALKSNFKGAKKVTVKKASAASTTIKKLKAGKKYYVRVRAYKNGSVNGQTETLYGAWSKAKKTGKIKK